MGGNAVLEGVVEDLGDVLVAVVGVEEVETPILGAHDERPCSNGLGGIPHELGTDRVTICGIQPLDAEEVVVDKAEVRGDLTGTRLLILHAAAKSIEGHSDDGVAGLPADGAVFGVVDDRPNTALGLDECLISIRIVLGREVIDGGVLVEVVGDVGLTLGGGAIADVIVGVGLVLPGNQLVANVVTVGLRLLRGHHGTGFADFGTATKEVVGVGVLRGDGTVDGVGHAGEKVALGFVLPDDGRAVGIGEAGLQVRPWEIGPHEVVHRGESPRGGIISDGLLAGTVDAVAHVPAEGVVMAGEGLGVEARDLLGDELTVGVVGEGGGADGIGGGGLAAHCVVGTRREVGPSRRRHKW